MFDALLKLRNNFTRWKDLQENSNDIGREEFAASVMELKNGIKSISWDLDELEESLGMLLLVFLPVRSIAVTHALVFLLFHHITDSNSERMAKLDRTELEKRKNFITQTREEVQSMSEKLSKSNSKMKSKADFTAINFGAQTQQNGTKYTRLINAPDASGQGDKEDILFNADDKSPYPDHST